MAVAALIIFSILIVVFYTAYNDQHKMITKGCTPTVWNQYGLATEMSCPAGVVDDNDNGGN